jgi:hypothetical protein
MHFSRACMSGDLSMARTWSSNCDLQTATSTRLRRDRHHAVERRHIVGRIGVGAAQVAAHTLDEEASVAHAGEIRNPASDGASASSSRRSTASLKSCGSTDAVS